MDVLLALPGEALIGAIGLLDSLPGYIRAMLAAALLVASLRLFEVRIPRNQVLYGQSFRKTALVVLVVIPLLVWLFPSSRMVVFVEELPTAAQDDHWAWQALAGIWLIGALAALARLLQACRSASTAARDMIRVEDEKLLARLAHWQRRLGMREPVSLVLFVGDIPRQLMRRGTIGIPAGAVHWPGTTRDIVLIQSLCHLKQGHGRWHRMALMVACLYWPVTWIQTLHSRLLVDFQRSADQLTESCYRDPMGYDRALRQLQQRLTPPAAGARSEVELSGSRWQAVAESMRHWRESVRCLLAPEPEPVWNPDVLVVEREEERLLIWTDPYDKVVLFVGQAMFLAFLLTGVTLKEKPPEFEDAYYLPFELLWKENFHRNQEFLERTQRME
jgi:hypothetical protein